MKTSELPYFITWTAQNTATTVPLDKVDQNYFYSGSKSWLNLSSISYQASFGLKNQRIIKAIQKQTKSFSLASPKQTFQLKENVSKRLISKAGGNYKCFYVQSGSEGIENAFKISRQVSSKRIILTQNNSYHGATMGALAATGDWRNNDHLLPRHWTKRFPAPHKDPLGDQLEKIIEKIGGNNIAAICIETITGGNGVFSPPQSWFNRVSKIQKKFKIHIILDEVVCAAHRTGPFFGFQNFSNLKPDFIVTAKAMTGGYFPLGVVLVSKNIAKFYNKFTLSCGLTNYGHPLGLAALEEVLNITDEVSFKKHLSALESDFSDFFKRLNKNNITTRNIGLLGAIDVENKLSLKDILDREIYCGFQNGRIILAPHLNIPKKKLNKGLSIIEELIYERTNN